MSDHITDTGKMVPDAWVDAALDAYSDNEWRTSFAAMRAALAAVAPIIAKAERDRCAELAETTRLPLREVKSGPMAGLQTFPHEWPAIIAAAIRALGDAT